VVRRTQKSRPAVRSSSRLVGEQQQRGDARGVVGLVLLEFSSAVASDRKSGIQRSDASSSAIRSCAAGLSSASHSPPSEANDFWGAK
jgi:hypothetical protein